MGVHGVWDILFLETPKGSGYKQVIHRLSKAKPQLGHKLAA